MEKLAVSRKNKNLKGRHGFGVLGDNKAFFLLLRNALKYRKFYMG